MKLRIVVILVLCCHLLPAIAGLDAFDFNGNVSEQRYRSLVSQLRCLVCQNQSLENSDADLAHDLRVEVYEKMQQGMNDDQVVKYLVARYGDFVLYNPPLKPSTYLIWIGPFVLLALGLIVLINNIRKRGQQTDTNFSKDEQARINTLLTGSGHREQKP